MPKTTDQEALQAALEATREALTRYELAIGSAQSGVWSWNLETNEHYRSPHWKTMLGYEGDDPEAQGILIQHRTHPEDLRRMRDETFPAFLKSTDTDYVATFRSQHRNGSWRWLQSRARAVRDDNGKALRITGIYLDVTAQHEAELRQRHLAEQDRKTAHILRASIQPNLPERIAPHFALHAFHEARSMDEGIGSDFYDAFPLAGGKFALVVGDVIGHGPTAALSIAEVRFTLRGFLSENVFAEPADTLRRLNRFLFESNRFAITSERHRHYSLAALLLAVVYPSTGKVRLSAAGMLPALIFRAATNTWEQADASDIILGADLLANYRTEQFTLSPGDILALTTDGIMMAGLQEEDSTFSVTDLGDALSAKLTTVSTTSPADRLKQSADHAFSILKQRIKIPLQDDVCFLLAQRLPNESPTNANDSV